MQKDKQAMTNINLRDFNKAVWLTFKSKCALEGVPMVRKLEELVNDYNMKTEGR